MSRMTRTEQLRMAYRRRGRHVQGREVRLDRDAIDDLLQRTEASDPIVRQEAVQLLCPCHVQADIQPVWNRLIAMVGDPDTDVRATILHTLCDGSPREREAEVVEALDRMYNDPDPKLRRRVRALLASYRRTGKINVL
jgi:hypothetical protein